MCMFSSPKAPTPAVVEAPAVKQAQESDEATTSTRDKQRQRRLASVAGTDTLVTGGAGLTTAAPTGLKSAYGA